MHKVTHIINKTYNNGLLQEETNIEYHNSKIKSKYVTIYNYYYFWYIISETYSWYDKEWKSSSIYYNKYRLNFMGWLLVIFLTILGIFVFNLTG